MLGHLQSDLLSTANQELKMVSKGWRVPAGRGFHDTFKRSAMVLEDQDKS